MAKAKSTPAAEPEPELAGMSMKVPRGLHDRLRKLAFDKRKPMTEYVLRGIEKILKEEGY